MSQEYTFKIDGSYSPESIPLERLGQYMIKLAELLGETANVHFRKLEPGSAVARVAIDHAAAPKVAHRVLSLVMGDADHRLRATAEHIDQMLAADNATGELVGGDNVMRIDFAGKNRPQQIAYGPIRQAGTLDGVVVRVEGQDATVHVGILDHGKTWRLEAPAAMGRRLAALFHAGPVRFHGTGQWYRQGDGRWVLRKFVIDRFEPLDDGPLGAAIAEVRKTGPSGWSEIEDPVGELRDQRGGEDRLH